MRKTAVICPGIGYHKDKPLLYYASKLAQSRGFEVISVTYHDMPQKIRGNAEMMRSAALLAFAQTAEQLADADLAGSDEILLIGKSIGTIAAAQYAEEHKLPAKQIWYTPLEATFSFSTSTRPGACLAFVGNADPWSDIKNMQSLAAAEQIPLSVYDGCNHSLESADVLRNVEILRDVMQKTAAFL